MNRKAVFGNLLPSLLAGSLACLLSSAGGCTSADGTAVQQPCLPNTLQNCTCPNGLAGTRVCLDGVSFSECSCVGPAGYQPVAGTGSIAGSSGSMGPAGSWAPQTTGSGGVGGQVEPQAGAGGQVEPQAGAGGQAELQAGAGGAVQPVAGVGGDIGAAGAAGTSPPPPPGSLCLQGGGGDYTAKGPYTITRKDVDLGGVLGPYTIFYPANLEANCPHPIVSWGNGTAVTGPDVYAFYHEHAASYGIVVIASHNAMAGSQPFIESGLDYLLAQNADPGSEFYGKLSTRAGVSGHSQGAMAATSATNHPNVQALVQVQGGGRAKAGVAVLALTGTADTVVGTASPRATYDGATGPACFANYQGADHITTPTLAGAIAANPGSVQYMRFYTMWFRCFLADDQAACDMFRGNPCPVCTEPGWAELLVKNM
jgi:hypothetical protein